jgi:hypothetical protein
VNNLDRAATRVLALGCANGEFRLVFRMPDPLQDLKLLQASEREVTAIRAAIVQSFARELDLAERRKAK